MSLGFQEYFRSIGSWNRDLETLPPMPWKSGSFFNVEASMIHGLSVNFIHFLTSSSMDHKVLQHEESVWPWGSQRPDNKTLSTFPSLPRCSGIVRPVASSMTGTYQPSLNQPCDLLIVYRSSHGWLRLVVPRAPTKGFWWHLHVGSSKMKERKDEPWHGESAIMNPFCWGAHVTRVMKVSPRLSIPSKGRAVRHLHVRPLSREERRLVTSGLSQERKHLRSKNAFFPTRHNSLLFLLFSQPDNGRPKEKRKGRPLS